MEQVSPMLDAQSIDERSEHDERGVRRAGLDLLNIARGAADPLRKLLLGQLGCPPQPRNARSEFSAQALCSRRLRSPGSAMMNPRHLADCRGHRVRWTTN